jgi:hypothetical protein
MWHFKHFWIPKRMPNQSTGVLDWPYVEGLRLDEAMHPLTILATGLYDETLPAQDGAPIRLVVPVEIWIQEHQVGCEDKFSCERTADNLEPAGARRVRVLFKR